MAVIILMKTVKQIYCVYGAGAVSAGCGYGSGCGSGTLR
jgi:hypothetical protein